MERVLRFNNTDQRITYNNGWKTVPDSENGPYSLTSTLDAQIFFLFRGIAHA